MDEQKETEKSEEKKVSNKKNITEMMRKNPWIVSTLILGALIIVLLIGSFVGGITGKVVSSNEAGENLVKYLNGLASSEVTLIDTSTDQDMYLVTVGYQGEEIPIYVTKDGKYYTMSLLPISDSTSQTNTQTQTEVPQTDMPSAGLFIWSYCPYGVTALKPFSQVAELLGDAANFKVYLYYAGHGDFEVQQNKIQACIQKLDSDNYWKYAETFVDEIYEKCYGDIDCDLEESTKLMDSLGIDSDAVLSCVDSEGEQLTEEDSNAAKSAGVSGSPTLVINGVKSNSARTAEAYKTAVCSAFTASPEECGQELDSTGTTASGNC